jgi:hypothetical protein
MARSCGGSAKSIARSAAACFADYLNSHGGTLEHDPEKWIPVSRRREARQSRPLPFDASAGEARSEKIMLNYKGMGLANAFC